MQKRELTCVICPKGCRITVILDENAVTSISGNGCKRGEAYAEKECTYPERTVTSTVRCSSGDVVSVKTDRPIPKEKIFECMKIINNTVADLPISIGDVIIGDVFGSNVIATDNK